MKHQALVPDDLWEAIEPFLPKEPPKPKGGRPRVPDRAALGGIVFVLRTGCPWRLLPKELDHEDGELTATQKVKRSAMTAAVGELVEEMYGGGGS